MTYAYLQYDLLHLPTAEEIYPSAVSDRHYSRVAQKTYVGPSNVYAVLYFGINNTTVICRAPKPNYGNKVEFNHGEDKMVLEHFGHSQTMEFFERDDGTYFWIGTKADADSDEGWSTQLARVKYQSGAKYTSNTQVQRISTLMRATPSGSVIGNGSLERFDAAKSDNGKLLIVTQDTNELSQMTIYDNDAVNDKMDNLSDNGYLPAAKLTDCLAYSKEYSGYALHLQNNVVPHDSIQGFELNNANAVYITCGDMGRTPSVTKLNWRGSHRTLELTNKYWGNIPLETESVQIKGADLYITIAYHYTKEEVKGKSKNQPVKANRIYKFDKSKFDD